MRTGRAWMEIHSGDRVFLQREIFVRPRTDITGEPAPTPSVKYYTAAEVDTLLSALEDGNVPHIGQNGNWFIGDADTGVAATGPQGAAAGFGTPTASATTLAAGSSATVSVSASGEDTAKVFNFEFGIPAGPQGEQGPQGSQGPAGSDGAPGAAAGFGTPTASATTLAAGSSATVDVSASGEDTAKVFNFDFGIPLPPDTGMTITPLAAASGTVTLPAMEGKVYTHTLAAGETIVLAAASSGYMPTVELHLEMPSTAVSFTFGTTIWWIDADGNFASGNAAPDFSTGGKVYALVFRFDGTRWLGNLAYTAGEPQIPTRGLVFYAPLASEESTAETGQSLTVTGNVVYGTQDGIPCADFNGTSKITFPDTGFPSGTDARTMSVWVKLREFYNNYAPVVIGYGNGSSTQYFCIELRQTGTVLCGGYQADLESGSGLVSLGSWYNVVVTKDGSAEKIYLNGTLIASGTTSKNTVLNGGLISGISWASGVHMLSGYIAAARIYNRVLTAQEIAVLSREFNPVEA